MADTAGARFVGMSWLIKFRIGPVLHEDNWYGNSSFTARCVLAESSKYRVRVNRPLGVTRMVGFFLSGRRPIRIVGGVKIGCFECKHQIQAFFVQTSNSQAVRTGPVRSRDTHIAGWLPFFRGAGWNVPRMFQIANLGSLCGFPQTTIYIA